MRYLKEVKGCLLYTSDMVLGNMKMVSGRFGPESTCIPYEDRSLEELLDVDVYKRQLVVFIVAGLVFLQVRNKQKNDN